MLLRVSDLSPRSGSVASRSIDFWEPSSGVGVRLSSGPHVGVGRRSASSPSIQSPKKSSFWLSSSHELATSVAFLLSRSLGEASVSLPAFSTVLSISGCSEKLDPTRLGLSLTIGSPDTWSVSWGGLGITESVQANPCLLAASPCLDRAPGRQNVRTRRGRWPFKGTTRRSPLS